MGKISKISYKVFLNDRLKEVSFHGNLTHPVYIQVTFKRIPSQFKSYYFGLLSKPKYQLYAGTFLKAPTIAQIIQKENKVIELIIEKLGDNFTMEGFLKEYAFLTADLCDVTEGPFNDFLQTFLADQGMPGLGRSLKEGNKSVVVYEVVEDLKISIHPELYRQLWENSLHSALPYLPLYGFAKNGLKAKWPVLLPVMEWEKKSTKKAFNEYLTSHFPNIDALAILNQVENFVGILAGK